jgi:hypothetical protein
LFLLGTHTPTLPRWAIEKQMGLEENHLVEPLEFFSNNKQPLGNKRRGKPDEIFNPINLLEYF